MMMMMNGNRMRAQRMRLRKGIVSLWRRTVLFDT